MTTSKTTDDIKRLIELLHDPVRLRMAVTGFMLVVAYAGIYMPLSSRAEEATRKLNKERNLQGLAEDIEYLREQVDKFQPRLPEKTDTNEWVQYVLGGIRKFPPKLISLDRESPKAVGPYKAVVLNIQLEGRFHDLDSFLCWLEGNERLFRVESVKIAPARQATDKLVMKLILLGLSE